MKTGKVVTFWWKLLLRDVTGMYKPIPAFAAAILLIIPMGINWYD